MVVSKGVGSSSAVESVLSMVRPWVEALVLKSKLKSSQRTRKRCK
jgi:hypothetical protein